MSELDRAVAELLGIPFLTRSDIKQGMPFPAILMPDEVYVTETRGPTKWSPSTDANQAQAAVREWCGENRNQQDLFVEHLVAITSLSGDGLLTEFYSAITATPEQLCRALLAAAKESK